MKKLIISFIALTICIVGISLVYKKDTSKFKLNNYKLLLVDMNNIISVRVREETEGGYFYYKTEDKTIINDIYNALNNIIIGREADINVVDDSREYIFDLNDGTQKTYSFHSSFYYINYTTYETENYNALKKIEIPKTENWNN